MPSEQDTRRIFPIKKVINTSTVYDYYVIKSGYYENRLTKQNHSTALLNRDRQGELLNKTPTYNDKFYTIYLITPRNKTWQHVQGMDKNNGNSCERYTFLY